jgi:hypothetical protein
MAEEDIIFHAGRPPEGKDSACDSNSLFFRDRKDSHGSILVLLAFGAASIQAALWLRQDWEHSIQLP